MGVGDLPATGNGTDKGIPRLSAGKYRRMDAQVEEEDEQDGNFLDLKGCGRRDSRKYVIACAIFASFNSVLLGYDVGVMSGAIIFIQKDLHITEVQQEILVGSLSFVSIIEHSSKISISPLTAAREEGENDVYGEEEIYNSISNAEATFQLCFHEGNLKGINPSRVNYQDHHE